MNRFLSSCIAALTVALMAATPVSAQGFKVIVNQGNATTELPSAVVTRLFLKQLAKFPDGGTAQPVDQAKSSATREVFTKEVLGRPLSGVESYWQQQIFSGKDVPPPSKPNDDEVIAFVKANPGAIGYVSGGANTSGVKVVTVK